MDRRVLLLLAALPAVTGFLFPTQCCQNWTGERVSCCPLYNGSKCGGLYNRGYCQELPPVNETSWQDWRNYGVAAFLNSTCVCSGNFRGANCGECVPGWRGVHCNMSHIVTRKDLSSMNETERQCYLGALLMCSFKKSEKWMVLVEGNRFESKTFAFVPASSMDVAKYCHQGTGGGFIRNGRESSSVSMAHNGPNFCCWHRAYLVEVERELQECTKNPNFALAYIGFNLDWAFTDDCLCSSDASGRLSKNCPFSMVRGFCSGFQHEAIRCLPASCYCERPEVLRRPGRDPDQPFPPPVSGIERCVNMSDYRSTCNCMESVHNLMHLYLSGDSTYTALATNDPVFNHFHCGIDRYLESFRMIRNFTPASYPTGTQSLGHGANECAACMYHCHRNSQCLRPSSVFGYEYDRLP